MELLEKITFFDKYRITQKLTSDEVSTVYIGEHVQTNEYVLIQILNPSVITKYDNEKTRFFTEMKKVRNFEQSSILRIYDVGQYNDSICIVYEYFEGIALDRYLDEHKIFEPVPALRMISQIATALRYAQGQGILHRNLRASSILILNRNGEIHAKIIDFGMSYIVDYDKNTETDIDSNYGYMSPEATGVLDRAIDERSDLYSLGVIFYQIMTGILPFHALTLDNMVYKHLAIIAKAPEEINSNIPPEVSNIITKLINKDPDLRYSTANELISDIDRYLCSGLIDMPSVENDALHGFTRKAKIYARSRELSLLRDMYEKAFDDTGCFCLVHGSLGSGKTDLMNNLQNDLNQEGYICFRSSFKAQYQMTPYQAFHNLLNEFAEEYGKYERKLQITEKNRLSALLGGLTGIVTKISSLMSGVLTESITLPPLDDYKEQQRSLVLLASFMLSLLPGNKPYALLLDDLQYADSSSLSLLYEIADSVSVHNVFVAVSMRDLTSAEDNPFLMTLISKLKTTNSFTDLTLKPFNETRMCEYLSDILGLARTECNVLSTYMIEKTDGNPYFTINVLRSMLEDGILNVNGRILEQDWEKLRKVNTERDVDTIISKRMSELDEDAIKLLEIAAVIGYDFSLELLTYITDLKISDISPWIEKAVSMHFIDYSSARNIMSFSHKQIHSLFLSRVGAERQRELHYWIGKALEAKHCTDFHSQIYRLVYHFLMADNDEGVKKYCLEAAETAHASNANAEAINYYRKALELMEADNENATATWISSKQALANLCLLCGHFEDAIKTAGDLLPHITNAVDKARLLKNIGIGYFRQSDFENCTKTLVEALDCVGIHIPASRKRLKAKLNKMKMHLNLISLFKSDITRGRLANGTSHDGSSTRRNSDGKEKEKVIIEILETLAQAYAYTDRLKLKFILLTIYNFSIKNFGLSPELGIGASALAVYYRLSDNLNKYRLIQSLTLNLRKSLGDRYGYARSLLFSGIFSYFDSEIERSIKSLKEAQEIFNKIGDLWEYNNVTYYLALAYFGCAKYDLCREMSEKTIELSSKLGNHFTELNAYSTLIRCHTYKGNYIMAEDAASKANLINEYLDIPFSQCYFNLCYGILHNEEGKYRTGEKYLSLAYSLMTEKDFVNLLVLTTPSHLAYTRMNILLEDHPTLSPDQILNQQSEINNLCREGISLTKHCLQARPLAYRIDALFSISIEKFLRTDRSFKTALDLAAKGENTFDTAKTHYDYGCFLLNKHRIEESRYNIFEAYMNFSTISSSLYIKRCEEMITEKYSEEFRNNSLLADVTAKRNRMNIDRKVNSLLRVGERLTSTIEIEELQNKILQDAVELSGAERGILFLYPESGEKKLYIASIFNTGNFDSYAYDWMLESIELNRQPIVINDVQSDEFRRNYSSMVRYGIKSAMAMPMFVRGKLYGVIYLDTRLVRGIFSDEYMETMGFIANQGGAPIENARLYHRAITDGLTQLYGRSYLDNMIIDKTSNPQSAKLSALMFDIDFFKKCNDTYGHQFGDEVLKQVAGIMKRISGAKGTACRYGGEEFVVLLDSDSADYAMGIGERIRQTVESTSVPFNEDTKVTLVSITISVGVSIWTPDMERVQLIEHADKALYAAKHNGRNQVVLWRPDLDE